jgi:predicted anti-sigma-YlaC factor YlaD
MRLVGQLTSACKLAREHISLHLDGELSEFEQVALDGHLRQCAGCREYGASIADVSARLRSAPLEQPTFPVVLPHRARIRISLGAAQAAAAAVVVAVIGFSAAGVTPGGERSASLSASATLLDRGVRLSAERIARGTFDSVQDTPRLVRHGVIIV